jgi:hypothetical protein
MANPLKIAPPPPRRPVVEDVTDSAPPAAPEPVSVTATPAVPVAAPKPVPATSKFRQVKEDERVQFNKRVTRRVADGFEMLAIRSRVKVPELLAEALELLEERYGRI